MRFTKRGDAKKFTQGITGHFIFSPNQVLKFNISLPPLHPASKRRKLDIGSSPATKLRTPNGIHGKTGSSQPKSQFESEVLEKLTQDINGLKEKNSEKDQQWERPGLDDFDPHEDALIFQQIEVEEGTLHGGRTTIKLFGVTEASLTLPGWPPFLD